MVLKRTSFFIVLVMFLCNLLFAQNPKELFEKGLDLYQNGKWQDAVLMFRRVQTDTTVDETLTNEALYWISLSELFAGAYEAALQDIELFIKNTSNTPSKVKNYYEAIYNKGRILYYLNQFDGAIPLFKTYADAIQDPNRKASAYYWIGECLFALGHFEEARNTFLIVTEKYPQSTKYEAASYRIVLVDQKKIENELLNLLKWSHEESLRIVEEYQRRERAYEQAILAYQKRIAEMLKDTHMAELEKENKELKQKLALLESSLTTIAASAPLKDVSVVQDQMSEQSTEITKAMVSGTLTQEQANKLLSLKASALELQKMLLKRLSESTEQGDKK
ncbi:tetratricopeptide repeat protein [Gracilinema caldarium]|uniref:Tetratricopeptide TPR_2 repeat-containing protein n=1 Tax=Gracilinema caldarium (strain ATCC 51460 / DSM 7334 / H1) TaxID=744872 RepID=F8F3D8_GRAC1|nr:tetratricopeptide repeat protein [Gracilinema caldarium]AEJ19514.1 Tetratricopeptide TPR_2 repeat-containing protein [Gracilinema caldarium DSM 7334]